MPFRMLSETVLTSRRRFLSSHSISFILLSILIAPTLQTETHDSASVPLLSSIDAIITSPRSYVSGLTVKTNVLIPVNAPRKSKGVRGTRRLQTDTAKPTSDTPEPTGPDTSNPLPLLTPSVSPRPSSAPSLSHFPTFPLSVISNSPTSPRPTFLIFSNSPSTSSSPTINAGSNSSLSPSSPFIIGSNTPSSVPTQLVPSSVDSRTPRTSNPNGVNSIFPTPIESGTSTAPSAPPSPLPSAPPSSSPSAAPSPSLFLPTTSDSRNPRTSNPNGVNSIFPTSVESTDTFSPNPTSSPTRSPVKTGRPTSLPTFADTNNTPRPTKPDCIKRSLKCQASSECCGDLKCINRQCSREPRPTKPVPLCIEHLDQCSAGDTCCGDMLCWKEECITCKQRGAKCGVDRYCCSNQCTQGECE